jgi:hypothetical protein
LNGGAVPEANDRTYHIGFASIQSEGLFEDESLERMVRESWVPGATVTRYGRTWHLTQMHVPSPGLLSGEIGFVAGAQVSTVFFDQKTQEFVSNDVSTGTRVPFVVDTGTGAVAYQLYPGLVRENSFTGALEGLLNTQSIYFLTVVSSTEIMTWSEWRQRVDKITSFEIRLDRPNPHYDDDQLIEDAIEGIRLEYMRLSGKALDEGANPEADLFQQAMDHVLREYGRASIHGVTEEGEPSTWVKVKNYAGSILARITVEAPGNPVIDEQELVGALRGRGDLIPAPPGTRDFDRDERDD